MYKIVSFRNISMICPPPPTHPKIVPTALMVLLIITKQQYDKIVLNSYE